METGQSLPDLLLLPQIAAFFDVTVDQLIGYEPQLSEQQIRKIYQELSGDFVKLSFDEAIEKCRKLVKTYYACYPFLYQIGNLWLNHVSLPPPQSSRRNSSGTSCSYITGYSPAAGMPNYKRMPG